MEPRVTVITLAVSNLDRSIAFYRDGLGLPFEGLLGTEFAGDDVTPAGAVAVFSLESLMLALYPRSELAKDAAIDLEPARSGEFSVGHLATTRAEVDAIVARAESAGAVVTDRPHDRPWGIYSGYFLDLDGHLWEIIWNPAMGGTSD